MKSLNDHYEFGFLVQILGPLQGLHARVFDKVDHLQIKFVILRESVELFRQWISSNPEIMESWPFILE